MEGRAHISLGDTSISARYRGKIGILVGNHRYRCQEMNKSGFRSYFREHAPAFTLLEPLSTFETSSGRGGNDREISWSEHPDLVALYVAGGGISGVMNALRTCDKAGKVVTVGYQLMDNTRIGLLDGTLTMVISHPLDLLASETIAGMIRACKAHLSTEGRPPFCRSISTRERISDGPAGHLSCNRGWHSEIGKRSQTA